MQARARAGAAGGLIGPRQDRRRPFVSSYASCTLLRRAFCTARRAPALIYFFESHMLNCLSRYSAIKKSLGIIAWEGVESVLFLCRISMHRACSSVGIQVRPCYINGRCKIYCHNIDYCGA
jgi:hypothetical protein